MTHRTRFRPALILLTAFSLTACDIKTRVPDFEYPDINKTAQWPSLVPTDQLSAKAPVSLPADKIALSLVADRAKALRARAANIRVDGISSSRITSLRSKATRLSNATF